MTTTVSDEQIEAIRGRYPGTVGNNHREGFAESRLREMRRCWLAARR